MKKVLEYQKNLEKELLKQRKEYLLEHGYVEQVACSKNEGGYIYNPEDGTYYKLVAVNGTDEELKELVFLDKQYRSLKSYKVVSGFFRAISVCTIIVGIILGIVVSSIFSSVIWFFLVFFFTLLFSILFMGLAKVIDILSEK